MYLWNHLRLSAYLGFGNTNPDISIKSNNEDLNDVTKKFCGSYDQPILRPNHNLTIKMYDT